MKKFLVLLAVFITFIACDFTKESIELKPDIEITFVNPVAYSTTVTDTTMAIIDEIHFVPMNSVDCHIEKMIFEYYDVNGYLWYGPFEIPMYLKIWGLIDRSEDCPCDTSKLANVPLPVDTLRMYAFSTESWENYAQIRFVAVDDYEGTTEDTVQFEFGLFVEP